MTNESPRSSPNLKPWPSANLRQWWRRERVWQLVLSASTARKPVKARKTLASANVVGAQPEHRPDALRASSNEPHSGQECGMRGEGFLRVFFCESKTKCAVGKKESNLFQTSRAKKHFEEKCVPLEGKRDLLMESQEKLVVSGRAGGSFEAEN